MMFINKDLRDLYNDLRDLNVVDHDDMKYLVEKMRRLDERLYDEILWCPLDMNDIPVCVGDMMMIDNQAMQVVGVNDEMFFVVDDDGQIASYQACFCEHKPEAYVIMVDPEVEAETIKADPHYMRPKELKMVFSSLKVATRYLNIIGYGSKYPAGTIWVEEFNLDTGLK